METTFITIHNLLPEANILFASDSITDVLGWQPHEVLERSCFEYFHPDEIPFARYIHNRGVELDKAAVLHYARILSRAGQYVGCECVFTIVYDVLVACTSIYQHGIKSERRALEAPTIRKLFASSPRDPRYHMLEHLSAKFRTPAPQMNLREPRAALILNRFTRSLKVLYATNSLADILGIEPEDIKDKSFYDCIAEECLLDAVRCLESAKANDSIAYLRFRYHDPRPRAQQDGIDGVDNTDGVDGVDGMDEDSSDSEDGGVELRNSMDIDSADDSGPSNNLSSGDERGVHSVSSNSIPSVPGYVSHRDTSSDLETGGTVLGQLSSPVASGRANGNLHSSQAPADEPEPIEIEAVVSCTSDGLVVIIRRARPLIPGAGSSSSSSDIFAAPWGVSPGPSRQPSGQASFQGAYMPDLNAAQQLVPAATGPPMDHLMNAIREVAVFAWALTGINGNLATHARGVPRGEAVPPSGYPIWDHNAGTSQYLGPENQAQQRWSQMDSTQWQHPRMSYPEGMVDGAGQGPYGFGYYAVQQQPQYNIYTYQNHEPSHHNHDGESNGGHNGEYNGFRSQNGYSNGNSYGRANGY